MSEKIYLPTSINNKLPVNGNITVDEFSGDYNDLTNKPTIPTDIVKITNDTDDITCGNNTNGVYFLSNIVLLPEISGTYTYNGTEQTVVLKNYDADELTVSGLTGTNAGTYTTTCTLKDGYIWYDGTTNSKSLTWTIKKLKTGAKPTTTYTVDYTGKSQNNGYTTPDGILVTGTTSGTDAGNYVAVYAPDQNHLWNDGTSDTITRTMTINKLKGYITLSSNSGSIGINETTLSFTATASSTISVTSSDVSIATAVLNSNTITCTKVTSSTATCIIGISAAESTNYTAAYATYNLSVRSKYELSEIDNISIKLSRDGCSVWDKDYKTIASGITKYSEYKQYASTSCTSTTLSNSSIYQGYQCSVGFYVNPVIQLTDGTKIEFENSYGLALSTMTKYFNGFSSMSFSISGSCGYSGSGTYYAYVTFDSVSLPSTLPGSFSHTATVGISPSDDSDVRIALVVGSVTSGISGNASVTLGKFTINDTEYAISFDLDDFFNN